MGDKRALAPSILKTLIAIFFFWTRAKTLNKLWNWFISVLSLRFAGDLLAFVSFHSYIILCHLLCLNLAS